MGFAVLTDADGISIALERHVLLRLERLGVDIAAMLDAYVGRERARLRARGRDLSGGSTLRFIEGEFPADLGVVVDDRP
jgi:hypothetical protein